MSENELETGQDTAEEVTKTEEPAPAQEAETTEVKAEVEEQPPPKEEEKKPEAEKAAAAEQSAPPAGEEEKKPKAEKKAAEQPTPPTKEKVKVSPAVEKMLTTIKKMTVLELAELVKALEAEFGVSAAAPVVAAAAALAPSAEAAAPAAEEQTEFSVILKAIGANKISVIKAVREVTTLGLKESKDLVESAPKAVREAVSKEEAATIKEKLETAGATAEIK